jgi:hypothetical protein
MISKEKLTGRVFSYISNEKINRIHTYCRQKNVEQYLKGLFGTLMFY